MKVLSKRDSLRWYWVFLSFSKLVFCLVSYLVPAGARFCFFGGAVLVPCDWRFDLATRFFSAPTWLQLLHVHGETEKRTAIVRSIGLLTDFDRTAEPIPIAKSLFPDLSISRSLYHAVRVALFESARRCVLFRRVWKNVFKFLHKHTMQVNSTSPPVLQADLPYAALCAATLC